jgi:transcriptional regulator with XRE-family HTH domain
MVNTDDFIKRLEIILDFNSLSASSFADKIGVQRSSLSHLLSGRNKPSLDFILKIIEVFPDVDLYWILNGKGTFPKSENKIETNIITPTPFTDVKFEEKEILIQTDLFSEKIVKTKNQVEEKFLNSIPINQISSSQKNEAEIDRIVIFYKNGTFKNYLPD